MTVSFNYKHMGRIVAGWLLHRKVTMALLFFALIASLFPLSLLWKVRAATVHQIHGVIDRQPGLRELFPEDSFRDRQWFEKVSDWPEVDYLVPAVLNGMMTIEVDGEPLDLVPTSDGDPITSNTVKSNYTGDVITLSALAARKFDTQVGGTLDFQIYRDNGEEFRTLSFTVDAILEDERDELSRGYVSLLFLEQLEAYRTGLAVKARRWPARDGQNFFRPPLFDGVVLAAMSPRNFPSNIKVSLVPGRRASELLGTESLPIASYGVVTTTGTVTPDDVLRIHEQIENSNLQRSLAVLPFVSLSGRQTDLSSSTAADIDDTGQASPAASLWGPLPHFRSVQSASKHIAEQLKEHSIARSDLHFPIAVAQDSGVCIGNKLQVQPERNAIQCKALPAQAYYADQIINLARVRGAFAAGLNYTDDVGWYRLQREYAGFRIYAKSLSEVSALQQRLRNEGIDTVSNQSFAASFVELDNTLKNYLILLSVFIVIGTISVISLNFAAVARMQTETYALLRQFGVSPIKILSLPCIYVLATIFPAWLAAELLASIVAGPISSAFGLIPGSGNLLTQRAEVHSSIGSSFYLFLAIASTSLLIVCIGTSRLLKLSTSDLFQK